jgi:hypothetical protein
MCDSARLALKALCIATNACEQLIGVPKAAQCSLMFSLVECSKHHTAYSVPNWACCMLLLLLLMLMLLLLMMIMMMMSTCCSHVSTSIQTMHSISHTVLLQCLLCAALACTAATAGARSLSGFAFQALTPQEAAFAAAKAGTRESTAADCLTVVCLLLWRAVSTQDGFAHVLYLHMWSVHSVQSAHGQCTGYTAS